ncbi:hypothetical protein POTOM_048560 [Populus tomentosa]|uniref:MACPF domain-containing protein n=1 Tax=Populus tomentosa TaxID=118781 RepID=A0A8X7YDC8_POPTO|nr:hypothetical protein POTOM_048560 [Populus tomentosa]
MSELLTQKSSVKGKAPSGSGYLNATFGLSGDWFRDTADSKYLAFDGFFISFYYLHLTASPLTLKDEVKKPVPPRWDPASLSRQKPSSPINPAEVRRNLEDLGDYLFSDRKSPPLLLRNIYKRDGRQVPEVFNRVMQCKDGLTIICTKRGGDVLANSLSNWLRTVTARPEAILFRFAPITSLLTGIPGSGYLSHAVNLCLRCKCSYD